MLHMDAEHQYVHVNPESNRNMYLYNSTAKSH